MRSLALALTLTSCLDVEAPCGPNQVFDDEANLCRCVAGAVLDTETTSCRLCPEGEEVVANACVCPEGLIRGDGGACVEPPPALGAACNTSDAPCSDSVYDTCALETASEGYCTKGCTADADCPATYNCAVWESPPFCERPPTGLGDPCADSTSCTGEANGCDTSLTHTCVVTPCGQGPDTCPRDYVCCDFTSLGVTFVCLPGATAATLPTTYCPAQ